MSTKKPNILHLFSDQMRADVIHALGNPVIKTPNLDRLVKEGTAFTNAFSPSPVCISARCSMIYGQYPANTGCYENTLMPEDGRQSFMGALTDAGYTTHGIGKCHFSPDLFALRGFGSREIQEEILSDPSKDDWLRTKHEKGYDYICDPHGIRGEMYYVAQPSQFPARDHPTQWIGDRSIKFIEERQEDESWYLYSSFIHPHPPFSPPNPWHKLYRAPQMPLPFVPQDAEALHTYVNRVQNRYKYRDQGIDNNLMRNMRAYYYACVSFIDYQVGRILELLEKTGQLDSTLILFSSDHGEHLGDYNCVGKRTMHDTCARVPMLCRLPGRFDAGKVCDTAVNLVDVAPTFLGAAGTDIASHKVDGVDLADIASGASDREYVFSQHEAVFDGRSSTPEDRAASSTYMAVSKDWKYFYSAPDDREWLFNRQMDPRESRNWAGMSLNRGDRDAMRKVLTDHLESVGENAGIEDGQWKTFPKKELATDPDTMLLIQDSPWAKTDIPGYTD